MTDPRAPWTRRRAPASGPTSTGRAVVRTLDLGDDDDDLRAFHRVRWASLRHGRPHVVPSRYEEFAHTWRSGPADDGWRKQAAGVFDGDALTAVAYVQESAEDALDTAWLGVHTDPVAQRRGLGAAALAGVLPLVDPTRTRLLASAVVPTERAADHGYRRFAERHGFTLGTAATTVALAVPDVVPLEPTPAGYRVVSHVDGVPPSLRVGRGVLQGLVDAQAPSGDIAWEAAPVTPGQYARDLAALTSTGGHAVETLVVHEATGEVVAFTEIHAYADPARPCAQEGTLVRRDHRGRGLGRAMKLANLAMLRAALPEHRIVHSESDDANTWMRAVNAGIGFRPVETVLYLQRDRP